MKHYIDKDAVIAMIDKFMYGANLEADIASIGECFNEEVANAKYELFKQIKDSINTLEVIDPYEKCIQHPTVKDGIEAHAEVYSFNIESELFPQLTKEQQVLWRKEIEQACISGGDVGYSLAKDTRYKENLEVKEVDLEKEFDKCCENYIFDDECEVYTAKHFFELGLKAQKGKEV